MIEVYDNPLSPYARKVRLALYAKRLDFQKNEIFEKSQRDAFLKINPRGEVPALIDDGKAISDSALICAYLEDKYPAHPLLPADPHERARCRWLEKVTDTTLDGAGILVFLTKFARPEVVEAFPDLPDKVTEEVRAMYSFLDRELQGRDYFAGEAFSLAEAALVPNITMSVFAGYALDEATPHLSRWLDRMNQIPWVQQDVADAIAAYEKSQSLSDPIFDNNHLHWRDHRIEALIRVGLGPWLLEELEANRGFLPPSLTRMIRE